MAYFIINWDFETEYADYGEKNKRANEFCRVNSGLRLSQSTWVVETNDGVPLLRKQFASFVRRGGAIRPSRRDPSDLNELTGGDHINIAEVRVIDSLDPAVAEWLKSREAVLHLLPPDPDRGGWG